VFHHAPITCTAGRGEEPQTEGYSAFKGLQPRSIHKIPQTTVEKAKYPVIDMHVHAPWNEANLEATALAQIKNMDEAGIERSIVFCGSGTSFEKFAAVYGKYPDRFELWCQVNLGGYNKPDFGSATIAELERCASLGAKGVGEVPDTGEGMRPFQGTSMHFDDPRMDPILEKLADLRMPINCHIGQEKWMYEAMDKHNDLLFEAYTYRIETYAYIRS
jgi:predicted TIM-barrel fold metal-dependent hydrolase